MNQITQLSLNLTRYNLSSVKENLSILFKSLLNLTSLKALDINLSENDFGYNKDQIRNLAKILSKTRNLIKLNLNFSENYFVGLDSQNIEILLKGLMQQK